MNRITKGKALYIFAVVLALVALYIVGASVRLGEYARDLGSQSTEPVAKDATTPNIDQQSRPGPAVDDEELQSIVRGQEWIASELQLLNSYSVELFSGNAERAQIGPVFDKLLVFPDGEAILITFDLTPLNDGTVDPELDDGKGPFFEPLREAAREGSVAAARRLHSNLLSCRGAPTTEDELDQQRSQLERGEVVSAQGRQLEVMVSRLEQKYRRCVGTNNDMMEEAIELLGAAADTGDIRSMKSFAVAIRESDPSKSEAVFRELWRLGYTFGLDGLGQVYRSRIAEAPADYSGLVTAYSHIYAAAALNLALYDGSVGEVFRDSRARMISTLGALQIEAGPSVGPAAIEAARALISENLNCCR